MGEFSVWGLSDEKMCSESWLRTVRRGAASATTASFRPFEVDSYLCCGFGSRRLEEAVEDNTAALQRELDEVRTEIAALEKALEEKADGGLGRGDPAVTRRELDRALLNRMRKRAASLEKALSRVGRGTYGVCERCGAPIHPDRLAVLPDATICIRCAQAERGK